MNVLLIYAHPEPTSLNGSLRDFSAQRLQAAKALGDAGNPQHHIFVLFCHVFALCGVQVFCVRLLPRSGAGHRPRGRNSMMTIMARAISSWRRMAESRRPSVMACNGPAT